MDQVHTIEPDQLLCADTQQRCARRAGPSDRPICAEDENELVGVR
jgi:hypothetical protein